MLGREESTDVCIQIGFKQIFGIHFDESSGRRNTVSRIPT